MKKYLVVLAAVLLSANALFAQSGKLAVGGDPLMLLLCDIRANAEYAITDSISVKADVEWSPNYFWFTNMQVFGLLVHGRYYWGNLISANLPDNLREFFQGPALKGLFAGVGGGFFSLGWSSSGYTASYIAPSILAEVGTKYKLDRLKLPNWYVEPVIGANILLGGKWTWKDPSGNTLSSWSGAVEPSYGGFYYSLNFGYIF